MCALAVDDVVELVGPDRAIGISSARRREVWTKWPGLENGAAGTSDELCAECAQRIHLLARLRLGHDDHASCSPAHWRPAPGRYRYCPQCPSTIVPPGLSNAPFSSKSRTIHSSCRAVLDRSARIGEFALAPDLATRSRARAFEKHQRRIADQVERCRQGSGRGHERLVRTSGTGPQGRPGWSCKIEL